jgi:colicin import membrane protein
MNDLTTTSMTPDTELAVVAVPTFDGKGYALSVFEGFKRQISRAKREAGKAEAYDITTTAGMNRAKELRAMFRDIRTSVENTRKERKAPIIESGKLLDARAAELKAEVEPFEDKFDAEIKAEEKRKADEKAKKEAEERARVEAIEERLTHIRGIPGRMAGADSQAIAKEIDQWTLLRLDPADFQEYLEDALRAVTTTIDQLGELRTAAEAREAEQRRVIAEREELARLKADQAERERVAAAEQAARDAQFVKEREEAQERQRQFDAQQAAMQRQQQQMQDIMDMQALGAALQATSDRTRESIEAALKKARAFNPADYGTMMPMAKMARDAAVPILESLLSDMAPEVEAEPAPASGATPLEERVPINPEGQYYSATTFRDDGKPILCNADGTRSIFCDVDEVDDIEVDAAELLRAVRNLHGTRASSWILQVVSDELDALDAGEGK